MRHDCGKFKRSPTTANPSIFVRFYNNRRRRQYSTLEPVECEANKDYIAPNVYKMNGTVVLREPLDNIWVHFKAFYRYARYQKFADHREDLCAFFKHLNRAPILKVVYDAFLLNKVQLNFKLQCPLKETLRIIHPRANMSHFFVPLVPAGRYRIDINITQGKIGIQIISEQLFFKISDLRIWH